MTNKFKQMQIQKIDQQLKKIYPCEKPTGGWIKTIRNALGINAQQLAQKLKMTPQSLHKLEENEKNDVITLKSLRNVAQAMGCQLTYAIIPKEGTLKQKIHKQAQKKATQIVENVNHSMMIENQEVKNKQEKIKQITQEIENNPTPDLWK